MFGKWRKDPIFTTAQQILDWRCRAAEFIQVAQQCGYVCWQAKNGTSFHFSGGKPTAKFVWLAERIHVQWWPPNWEKRVLEKG